MIDHRGTGRSTLVDCNPDEETLPCIQRLAGIWTEQGLKGNFEYYYNK